MDSAVQAIDQAGALLVFPLDNRSEPASLWSHFHPRSAMRWEWDDSGDNRVANLWRLKGELSTTRRAVYTKWFRGRATYFSRSIFPALLRALNPAFDTGPRHDLSPTARALLSLLDAESPLSTKQLKALADLKGKANEARYEKALKELWSRLLVVAFGEVDDGAFPSLAIGSTHLLYEDLWQEALSLSTDVAEELIRRQFPEKNLFYLHLRKLTTKAAPRKRASNAESGRKAQGIPRVVRFDKL